VFRPGVSSTPVNVCVYVCVCVCMCMHQAKNFQAWDSSTPVNVCVCASGEERSGLGCHRCL
jgi:hypothetical protein